MRLLLLGADGQIGWQLRRSLAVLGEVVALTPDSKNLCGDLRRPDGLAQTLQAVRPDVVVNAAAYTAVDRAETEPEAVFAINAIACEALARETQKMGAWLVHYSTDYVYDGSGERPWVETDLTAPLGVYGKSKLAGDEAIASLSSKYLILRTSWVYDSRGQNFVKSILKAAASRESLSVVADQWGSPTHAALIADITAHTLLKLSCHPAAENLSGVYHLAASGFTHWHAYACFVIEQGLACGLPLRVTPDKVQAISSAEYTAYARRPANSRLDTARLRETFGLSLAPWQDGVRAVVAELAGQSRFLNH